MENDHELRVSTTLGQPQRTLPLFLIVIFNRQNQKIPGGSASTEYRERGNKTRERTRVPPFWPDRNVLRNHCPSTSTAVLALQSPRIRKPVKMTTWSNTRRPPRPAGPARPACPRRPLWVPLPSAAPPLHSKKTWSVHRGLSFCTAEHGRSMSKRGDLLRLIGAILLLLSKHEL